jgi:hypothetical protein
VPARDSSLSQLTTIYSGPKFDIHGGYSHDPCGSVHTLPVISCNCGPFGRAKFVWQMSVPKRPTITVRGSVGGGDLVA